MTVSETVFVVLPMPARVLSPNRPPATMRGRYKKAAAAKKLRRLAREAAQEAAIDSAPWPLASVSATFFCRVDRRRDPDNYMAMLKPAYDGLVDAGLLVDDDWCHLKRGEPQFELDREYPRVELTVTRREA